MLVTGAGLAAYGYLVTALTRAVVAVQDGLQRRVGWSLGVTATVLGIVIVVAAALLRPARGGNAGAPSPHRLVDRRTRAPGCRHRVPASGRGCPGGLVVMMPGGVLCFTSALGAPALDGDAAAGRLGVAPARTRCRDGDRHGLHRRAARWPSRSRHRGHGRHRGAPVRSGDVSSTARSVLVIGAHGRQHAATPKAEPTTMA